MLRIDGSFDSYICMYGQKVMIVFLPFYVVAYVNNLTKSFHIK